MQKVTFPLFSNSSLSTGRGSKVSLELSFLQAEHLCALLWICSNSSLSFSCSGPPDLDSGLIFELVFPTRRRFHGTDPNVVLTGLKACGKFRAPPVGIATEPMSLCHQTGTVAPQLVVTALPQGTHSKASLEQEGERILLPFLEGKQEDGRETSSSPHPCLPKLPGCPFWVFYP